MTVSRPPLARWHTHVNATRPSANLRDWLTLGTSLTARLRERSAQFAVRRLRQHIVFTLQDECDVLSIPHDERVHEREVLLCCDDVPVVFAHTVMPFSNTHDDWPAFHDLGEQSLGALLFDDPLVSRGALQFSRLPLQHPLVSRIYSAIPAEQIESRLHARRCLFQRKRSKMLVTEVFLPRITQLK